MKTFDFKIKRLVLVGFRSKPKDHLQGQNVLTVWVSPSAIPFCQRLNYLIWTCVWGGPVGFCISHNFSRPKPAT